MPDPTNLLLIERSTSRRPSRAPALRERGYTVSTVDSVDEALARDTASDIVILDAASMRTSGLRMIRRLRRRLNGTSLILLSAEGTDLSRDGAADALLVEPFTERKLLNRIQRAAPVSEDRAITFGPLQFDPERQVVRRGAEQTYLNPMLSKLLEHLLKNKGRLVTREQLMKAVWDTDYTDDMRTIDVHISWLRQAIEEDAGSPQLLKTIRGLGYRLDLPAQNS